MIHYWLIGCDPIIDNQKWQGCPHIESNVQIRLGFVQMFFIPAAGRVGLLQNFYLILYHCLRGPFLCLHCANRRDTLRNQVLISNHFIRSYYHSNLFCINLLWSDGEITECLILSLISINKFSSPLKVLKSTFIDKITNIPGQLSFNC